MKKRFNGCLIVVFLVMVNITFGCDPEPTLVMKTVERANLDRRVSYWVACPEGYVTTGGGIKTGTPGRDNWAQSYPDPYDHFTSQWRGAYDDNSGTLYAQCGKVLNSSENLQCRVVKAYAASKQYAYASCSQEEVVTGGGIETLSPGDDNISISWPANATTWGGYHNDNGGYVYAVCCQKHTADYSLNCNISKTYVNGYETETECADGYKATGGGVYIKTPGEDNITLSYPINDTKWGYYHNDESGSVYSVCCKVD